VAGMIRAEKMTDAKTHIRSIYTRDWGQTDLESKTFSG